MSLIDALPGIRMPVSKVEKTLADMWRADLEHPEHDAAPSEFRAVQLNLIVHFGLKTTTEEAKGIFETAIRFAQRYPSRIIVLCPEEADKGGDEFLSGKLFVQCYTGEFLRDMCCCEALMLGYPVGKPGYLESQVSVWLETDLPAFHWFHRVPAKRIQETYLPFVSKLNRTLYDSDVEGHGIAEIEWPEGIRAVDLAWARNLPIRQTLGQFLSGFEPRTLVEGLEHIEVRAVREKWGAGAQLLSWMQEALVECAEIAGLPPKMKCAQTVDKEENEIMLATHWYYCDDRFFQWQLNEESRMVDIRARFEPGTEPMHHNLVQPRLPLEDALSEAMFFS